MFLNESGGVEDDIIVYNLGKEYMVVVNAGNLDKDFERLSANKPENVELKNISSDICLLALQGPRAPEILQSVCESDVLSMKYFTCADVKLKNISASFLKAARTGYTGEDGYEIFISKESAQKLWDVFLQAGAKPCGLGCRDTLRLEACMPLHGHEIAPDINPVEAGFQKTVGWDSDFIGKEALLPFKNEAKRKLIAFECLSGIARANDVIFEEDTKIGTVTSGTFSPTLKKAIGMALIGAGAQTQNLFVEIRSVKRPVKEAAKPFYKRIK